MAEAAAGAAAVVAAAVVAAAVAEAVVAAVEEVAEVPGPTEAAASSRARTCPALE